nr:MAG TPA: hypothetical protein [Caudoviricetes sp.]
MIFVISLRTNEKVGPIISLAILQGLETTAL